MSGWTQTFSHHRYYPLDPNPAVLRIEDFAHALSMLCRFGGMCSRFYSLGQHALFVSRVAGQLYERGNNQHRYSRARVELTGLLHDNHECLGLGDVASPVKKDRRFAFYREVESLNERAIAYRFGGLFPFPVEVIRADSIALATEARDLMSPLVTGWDEMEAPLPEHVGVEPMHVVEATYLQRYDELRRAL